LAIFFRITRDNHKTIGRVRTRLLSHSRTRPNVAGVVASRRRLYYDFGARAAPSRRPREVFIMCGIAGVLSLASPLSETELVTVRAMTNTLRHRGPDDWAVRHGALWAVGNTRLKIIDLSDRANLPMTTSASCARSIGWTSGINSAPRATPRS
jgi:asparagine synthase (glutamine-hydrolysing)